MEWLTELLTEPLPGPLARLRLHSAESFARPLTEPPGSLGQGLGVADLPLSRPEALALGGKVQAKADLSVRSLGREPAELIGPPL